MKSPIMILIILALSVSGNLLAQNDKNPFFKRKRNKVDISNLELRLRLTDFFILYTEHLEETADKIYNETTDPEVRKAALMWKIYGISAMNKAINMPDPIASFYNAWPLTKQSVVFFESGYGKEAFGEYYNLALQICKDMETKLDSIIIDIGGMQSFLDSEPEIDIWVGEHPIKDFYFTRESTLEYFAEWLGEERFGLGSSVSTLTEQVLELSNRINLYADILPRQARWQADFALMNYLEDTAFILGRIDQLILSLERVAQTVDSSPDIIDYNRDLVLKDIERQRKETLDLLIKERKAVINQLIKERTEVVKVIANERLIVLDQLENEREIVLEEIRKLSGDLVQQSGQEIERIVDKIFWRTVILIAVIGAIIFISVLIYKKA